MIGQSAKVMKGSVDRLIEMSEAGTLAGHMFWSWQDMREYSRIDAEMHNGVLESGVVTEGREPRNLVWMELERLFHLRRHEAASPDTKPAVVPLTWSAWSKKNKFQAVDLRWWVEGASGDRAWASFEKHMEKYWSEIARSHWKETGERFQLWRESQLEIAGVRFQIPAIKGYIRPIILTPESPEVTIPVDLQCERVHILGQVMFGSAFPTVGKDGDTVASYTLQYSNGKKQEIPLRNGYEVVQANFIRGASRLDPVATEAQRVLIFVKDTVREHYQIQLFSTPAGGGKLANIRCQLRGEQSPLAIFAVTAEQV